MNLFTVLNGVGSFARMTSRHSYVYYLRYSEGNTHRNRSEINSPAT